MLSVVGAIGREPSFITSADVSPDAPDLGYVREYKLLAQLGQGGMGAVYKAMHTKLKRVVALKVLPADRLQGPARRAHFEREMEAVRGLTYPNIRTPDL